MLSIRLRYKNYAKQKHIIREIIFSAVKCHPRPLLSPEPSPQPLTHRLPARFWRRILAETSRSDHARDLGQDIGRQKARRECSAGWWWRGLGLGFDESGI